MYTKSNLFSYTNPSSLRPISINNVVFKLMEWIVLYWIEEYLETNIIIDEFRQFLYSLFPFNKKMVKLAWLNDYHITFNEEKIFPSIVVAFNKKMVTRALFVDVENDYDIQWRKSLHIWTTTNVELSLCFP